MLAPLSQLFLTERHRPRAGDVGHSVPLASEIDIDDQTLEPILVTSTRGAFLQSRVARGGFIRFGFCECPLDREGALLWEFHKSLVEIATETGWACLAASAEEAVTLMRAKGETPFHLVAGPWLEAEEIGGARVLDVGLPKGLAIAATSPSRSGLHTRIGEYVGVVAYRVDRCFVAVTAQ